MDASGKEISTQKAYEYGWIKSDGRTPRGWGIPRHEVPLGENLFVDGGRQLLSYCFGYYAPISSYVCAKFGVGTGTTPAKVTDVALQNPIEFSPAVTTKSINGIDFPTAFVARVEFTLGANEANGYLITELGLFSGNDTLYARRTTTGINKSSDFSPQISWRLRFILVFWLGMQALTHVIQSSSCLG